MHESAAVTSTGSMWVAAILFLITYGVVMSEKSTAPSSRWWRRA